VNGFGDGGAAAGHTDRRRRRVLDRPRERSDLVVALRSVEVPSERPDQPSAFGLTQRELQVVALIVAAAGNKKIAETLAISEKTVKHHLSNIFEKLGVSSRLELAQFATRHRLTPRE